MVLPQKILSLYLLALFFMGVAWLAITPPFEGFDENAHFSSLRQVADTHTVPVYGGSYLDRTFTDYQGPIFYGSLEPPFDKKMTYAKFFADPLRVEQYKKLYRSNDVERMPYSPGEGLNWQAQHPPTYYMLLAPLTKATDKLPLVTQVFLLRLASFILALGGVAFGFLAVSRKGKKLTPPMLGFLLYPIILPMFFLEFARLGNDSLCLLLTGVTAYLVSLWLDRPQDKKLLLSIGAALGIGLLTKAFFLPISAGVGLFMLFRLWDERRNQLVRTQRFWDIAWVFIPALIIGGGWYAYKFLVFGDLTGSHDAIRVAQQGGLFVNLKQNFSLIAFARSFLVMLVTWSWGGTLSLTRLPEYLQFPCVLLAVWLVVAFITQVRRRPLGDAAWLPVWTMGLFAGSLFYYAILTIALDGNGGAPGWYFHILFPWVAPALGLGVCSILKHKRARIALIGLLLYTMLFQIMVYWSQLSLFTGCATKANNKHYLFSGPVFCLDQISTIIDRLSALGWPLLAAGGWGMGLICIVRLYCISHREIKAGLVYPTGLN